MPLRLAIAFLFAFPSCAEDAWRALLASADKLHTDGRFTDAERAYRSALDEALRLQPDSAPAATAYHNLASLYQDMGRCDPAIRAYQESVTLWTKAGGQGKTYLLRSANHLVALYLQCGLLDEAERHYRELVAPHIADATGADRADALTNLGSIDFQKRRYRAALEHYREALAFRGQSPSLDLAILLNNLASALQRTGDLDRALEQSRQAIAMLEAAPGPARSLLVTAILNDADLLLMTRRFSEAEPQLDRALGMARELGGDDDPLTATVMSHYAVLLKRSGRSKEAAAFRSRARDILARSSFDARRVTVDVRELELSLRK